MAGAGYKSWVDGDILTAADVNTYLMQQAVMRFADSAARTSAIAAPSEGMVTYLVDTDAIEYYDGAAWQPILDQDVIEAKGDLIVGTADDAVSRLAVGTNEHRLVADSGESTGLKYVADTTNYAIAAKGDLLAGTAADTLAALSVGTNGYVLTADSAETTGLKWAAAAGAGKVLQVVQNTTSTPVTVTGTTLGDSGLSATITPSSATSKVLVIVSQSFGTSKVGSLYVGGGFKILRGATAIYDALSAGNYAGLFVQIGSSGTPAIYSRIAMIYLDSPATTSATTYKTQMAGYIAGMDMRAQLNSTDSSMILLEIGA